jgi:superfamily II DNA or RNA helicase/DNA-binding XRE family transcriptional regulator
MVFVNYYWTKGGAMGEDRVIGQQAGLDYAERIKRLRLNIGLTQQALADRLGVSFATVNRWENNQSKPSKLYWNQLLNLETSVAGELDPNSRKEKKPPPILDFTAPPEVVKILAEGERLSFGHLMNPTFATEISNIDPLPHQRIAVYDHMLHQTRLRFLLADDAGAGKTIMSGLYIREMLSRRLLRRILIVTPAGLVGNWHRELLTLFNLSFQIVAGSDARNGNPFLGEAGERIIISLDTLCGSRMFARLGESDVAPYDIVIFDEAHKLAADRGSDLRVRKTGRYQLAEALAGVHPRGKDFQLGWSAHHLLLLTATPHMGKDFPYFALWRLLEPEILATPDAFDEFPFEQRRSHFIRRTKEEMVYLDGRPLYPKRLSDTLGYELSQGDVSEQRLYDETTDYLRFVYNKAKMLNREAARLAMSVFQRRLASSTFALLRSFERRIEKLDKLIDDIQSGRLTTDQLITYQQRLFEEGDVFDTKTADDEASEEGYEENEISEDKLLQGVVAASLADLVAEKEHVNQLLHLARRVHEGGHESKFVKLREVLMDPRFIGEKFIIFTEHRDTLEFLIKRLDGIGFTDQIAQIHGGMHYSRREEEVERFRKPCDEGGARFLVCTDAAGEGINLQFCWIMINYDVPWNPARLEQRMGRIHRYGQKHDPVVIMNLVAPSTREGKVLKVLLDKLEKIRKELNSDKVFDCIGRIFQGVSIKQYMETALTDDAEEVTQKIDGSLTREHVEELTSLESSIYGVGGDVEKELPRIRSKVEQEIFFRLMPGYIRQYIQQAAPVVDIGIEGDAGGVFSLIPIRLGAMDPLLPVLELYPESLRERLSIIRPMERKDAVWIHPGEPVFERFRSLVRERLADAGKRGAVFIDPGAVKPYLFHLALLSVVRKADPELTELAREEVLDCSLVGVMQHEGVELTLCPIEHLLLLKGGYGIPASAQRLAVAAAEEKELVRAYLSERVAREMAMERKTTLAESIPERERFISQGFNYKEAELAAARARHSEKARKGNRKAIDALEEVKRQQRELTGRRENALAVLRREADLIAPGEITFVAHALVVPSSDPADIEKHDANVEMVAMQVAQAFEEAEGAKVVFVHTPELARKAGLPENPGFDLLSIRPGNEKRSIEVKGRASTGDIEVSANEWAKACNIREGYWLYAVYNCASPAPRLVRVQDPFGRLLAKAKGSVLISQGQVVEAGEG